jgi:hypothetical protein
VEDPISADILAHVIVRTCLWLAISARTCALALLTRSARPHLVAPHTHSCPLLYSHAFGCSHPCQVHSKGQCRSGPLAAPFFSLWISCRCKVVPTFSLRSVARRSATSIGSDPTSASTSGPNTPPRPPPPPRPAPPRPPPPQRCAASLDADSRRAVHRIPLPRLASSLCSMVCRL